MNLNPQQAADLAVECLCTPFCLQSKIEIDIDSVNYGPSDRPAVTKIIESLSAAHGEDVRFALRVARSMSQLESFVRADAPEPVKLSRCGWNGRERFEHYLCYSELAYAIVYSRVDAVNHAGKEIQSFAGWFEGLQSDSLSSSLEDNPNYGLSSLLMHLKRALNRFDWNSVSVDEFRVKLKREVAHFESSVPVGNLVEPDQAITPLVKKSPNQNNPEKRKQKIRSALKDLPKSRGKVRTRLQNKIARWRKDWSTEFVEVEKEKSPLSK